MLAEKKYACRKKNKMKLCQLLKAEKHVAESMNRSLQSSKPPSSTPDKRNFRGCMLQNRYEQCHSYTTMFDKLNRKIVDLILLKNGGDISWR